MNIFPDHAIFFFNIIYKGCMMYHYIFIALWYLTYLESSSFSSMIINTVIYTLKLNVYKPLFLMISLP